MYLTKHNLKFLKEFKRETILKLIFNNSSYIIGFQIYSPESSNCKLDLCQNCYKSFKNWYNTYKKNI